MFEIASRALRMERSDANPSARPSPQPSAPLAPAQIRRRETRLGASTRFPYLAPVAVPRPSALDCWLWQSQRFARGSTGSFPANGYPLADGERECVDMVWTVMPLACCAPTPTITSRRLTQLLPASSYFEKRLGGNGLPYAFHIVGKMWISSLGFSGSPKESPPQSFRLWINFGSRSRGAPFSVL